MRQLFIVAHYFQRGLPRLTDLGFEICINSPSTNREPGASFSDANPPKPLKGSDVRTTPKPPRSGPRRGIIWKFTEPRKPSNEFPIQPLCGKAKSRHTACKKRETFHSNARPSKPSVFVRCKSSFFWFMETEACNGFHEIRAHCYAQTI